MLANASELCDAGFTSLASALCTGGGATTAIEELDRRHAGARRRFGGCAVVGASGSLSGSALGARIDAFETVVRVNRAPTAGWERDVGRRTTVRVMSADELSMTRAYRKGGSNATLEEAEAHRPSEIVVVGCHGPFRGRCDARRLLLNVHPRLHTYLLSPSVARRASRRTAARQRSPPAGMMAIEFALHACSRVTVFGFAHPSCANRSACYHYYSLRCRTKEADMRRTSFSAGFHDFGSQEEILRGLEARRRLTRVACASRPNPSVNRTN